MSDMKCPESPIALASQAKGLFYVCSTSVSAEWLMNISKASLYS